ncbi:tetratricopeptide repeat protein [Paenibacillus macerans]|uniref:tetratricopeptide repeat protein n=1 Tax=Paenibacillus macerans TaxID=44252 RepID=UPI002E232C7F|nr:tetratricopeptide repeat protein [Paenibacillus macerans]
MEQRLMDQLNEWHEADEHQRIVDTLSAIPDEERDYEAISHLARAYNNLGLYEEALSQFDQISKAGKQDPLWHYRVGFALYYLKRYEEAAQAFRRSDQLEPGVQNTEYFLRRSIQKAEKQKREELRLARKTASMELSSSAKEKVLFSD